MEIIINVIDYFMIYRYYQTFFKMKNFHQKEIFLFLYSILCIILMVLSAGIPEVHILISSIVILVTSVFYDEIKSTKIIIILFLFLSRVLSQFLAMSLMGHVFEKVRQHGFLTISRIQMEQVVCVTIKYCSVLALCIGKKEKNVHLPKKIIILLFGILLSDIIGSCFMYQILLNSKEDNHHRIFTYVMLLFWLVHYLTYILLENYNHVVKQNYEHKLLLREKQLEVEYCNEIEDNIRTLRKIRHDYKNQLLSLLEISEYDKAGLQEEIRNMLAIVDKSEKTFYTRNRILNGICRVKFREANTKNIELSYEIFLPEQINMYSYELGVLYGNLLDNALEACEKINEGKRYIILKTYLRNEKLLLNIKNSKSKLLSLKRGLKTSKADSTNHGFGIQSVQEIIDKYHGVMHIEETEYAYEVQIMLYGIHEIVI